MQDAGPGEQEDNSRGGENTEVAEAAERRAGELGIDLSDVIGTGSRGRILVTDVEAAAEERQMVRHRPIAEGLGVAWTQVALFRGQSLGKLRCSVCREALLYFVEDFFLTWRLTLMPSK
jgi:pyruvate/2-oxoglutarate dehydrogenase complex dihydrolipoamide acyltransferase (E2) component